MTGTINACMFFYICITESLGSTVYISEIRIIIITIAITIIIIIILTSITLPFWSNTAQLHAEISIIINHVIMIIITIIIINIMASITLPFWSDTAQLPGPPSAC